MHRHNDLLEIQILELKKLPKVPPKDNDVISWMRFFKLKRHARLRRTCQVACRI